MSGFGERFRSHGYEIPKPLIEVEGLSFINHVVNLFSPLDSFFFICNEDHLKEKRFNMRKIIYKNCKNSKIISIKPHKLGPIHAITKIKNYLNLDESVVVNYCDFTCYWNWRDFKKEIKNYDGIIPAYKGFHPHSLGDTNYAYIQNINDTVIDIQEKQPFTSNKMNEYASSGTYFFKSASLMFKAFEYVIKEDLSINGEYYVSMAYKYLLNNKLNVKIYPLQHFMQWGTPEDLDEYKHWSNTFKKILNFKFFKHKKDHNLIMPMAGFGKRFKESGFELPKPLINISGESMMIQAVKFLPMCNNNYFILRKDKFTSLIKQKLVKNLKNTKIVELDKPTDGQASSCLIGINKIKNLNPVTISACDNGVIYDQTKLYKALNQDYDILVWGTKLHYNSNRNPEMYGWIEIDENNLIKKISVKKKEKSSSHIVIGTFTFKNKNIFIKSYDQLVMKKDKVNNEYYVDSMINHSLKIGYKCLLLEVDNFISWGTPNEYNTFQYWQSCFHKWKYHPYLLENDPFIKSNKLKSLKKLSENFKKN